ncbi:MAG: hemerythrin domain-containing protein [Planctomycetaceae bacterium]|nr:hemerythrin domain-containing protein [Planctomycetaceae bacterium]
MSDMNSERNSFVPLEEHTKLRRLLSDLKDKLAQQSAAFREVVDTIQQLGDQIDVHFHAEEASDCFPELVNTAPRVSNRVATLLAEHDELRAEMHQIVQGTRSRSGTAEDWEQLASQVEVFTGKLMAHERAENELVQEVFTDDIGSKD